MFLPAMCLISFGGPGVLNATIHLSNLFPDWRATTTAFITGSFQLSFLVFFMFDQLWSEYSWDFRVLFMGYCVVCFVNAIVSLLMWPDTPYDAAEEEQILDELQGSVHRQHPKVVCIICTSFSASVH